MTPIHHPQGAHRSTTDASGTPEQPFDEVDTPQRKRVWRVGDPVATSLLGALVLTLGAFVGTHSHIVSRSALLAFAGTWVMGALLSTRFTSRAHRWAPMSAATMAAAALTLLIAQPNDHALDAAGWGWARVVLAPADWIFV